MSSYSGAVFVVGGSGITFALSAVQDIVLGGTDNHVKIADIVWCTQHPSTPHVLIANCHSHIPLNSISLPDDHPTRVDRRK